MQCIKSGSEVNVKLALPVDLPWKIYGALARDLGADENSHPEIFGFVRNRDVNGLLSFVPNLEARCILEESGSLKRDAHLFFLNYQLGAFLKKYPFKGLDTKGAAIAKFEIAERQCSLFNKENYKALLRLNESHPDFLGVIEEIREDIRALIGDVPPVNSILDHAKHGPGVSLGDSYKDGKSTSYFKWSSIPYTVTKGTLPYARTAIETDPRWIGALDQKYRHEKSVPIGLPISTDDFWLWVFNIVDGSRITTVPKTALTDRTIAIEPLMNVFIQLGVDSVLKILLRKKWGYDLSTQELNQMLAFESSISDLLATLDLKAASDTIALMCCELLLPAAWYDLLLDLRSPQGVLDGKVYTFEKISSMGNGFTFALESLIFGALARCAIRRTRSMRKSAVFGDDIIVPSTAVTYLQTLLEMFGFRLNDDKSFKSGPFRESCGKDFFLGYNVRPLFLKRRLLSVRDLFYVYNSLHLMEKSYDWTWEVDFTRTKDLILKYIPKNIKEQFYGPESEARDTHLFSERKLQRNPITGIESYWYIKPKAKIFNKRTDFYFRKLMCTLREKPDTWLSSVRDPRLDSMLNRSFGLNIEPIPHWDKNRKLNTGNAFDVTKSGKVLLVSARCEMVRTISPDLQRASICRLAGLGGPANS